MDSSNTTKKPEKLKGEHLEYLTRLRDSGVVNMFGAGVYLQREYADLSEIESREILSYWMKTFRP